ncbi:MAG: hypothetical protein ABR556_03420 [Pyrinomonadaceae bacterium]
MDIKKKLSLHRHPKRKKGDTAQLAALLAPPEELDPGIAPGLVGGGPNSSDVRANRDPGAIVVDRDNLTLPKDMMEGRDEKTFLGMEPVVLVILGVMLVFITFIAWQISLMPAP